MSNSSTSTCYNQIYEPYEIELPLRIDKLTILPDMPPQLAEGSFEYLWGCAMDKEFLLATGLTRAFGPQLRGYKLSLGGRIPCKDGTGKFSPSTGFLIQVGPKNPDDAPVRLDLNPECLTPYGFAHMIHTLTGIIQIDLIWVQLGRVNSSRCGTGREWLVPERLRMGHIPAS